MNLLVFFHNPNFMPIFMIMLIIGMPLVLFIVLRAIYIVARRPTRLVINWGAAILGANLVIWPFAYWSSNVFLEIAMLATTVPFGMALGSLHGDLWYFVPRDMLLGAVNSAYHPITPHIFVERGIINAAVVVWILDWWERRRPKTEVLSQSEFAEPTLL
jgi:hypothetical protein